jgi:uncharacterized protein YqhQ
MPEVPSQEKAARLVNPGARWPEERSFQLSLSSFFSAILGHEKMAVGGQAVIEGVMMRSPTLVATAVRRPDGEISVRRTGFVSISKRKKLLGLPVIRGAVVLIETLSLGISALTYSAEEALKEEGAEEKDGAGKRGAGAEGRAGVDEQTTTRVRERIETGVREQTTTGVGEETEIRVGAKAKEAAKEKKKSAMTTVGLVGTIILSLGLGFLLFFYLPLFVAERIGIKSGFWFNLVDGAVRLVVFVLYIGLVGLWGEMRKLYQYHGAEHKSIYAFEAGEELTVENAMKHSTLHPRCGTSFLLMVVVVSLVVFIALGKPESWVERAVRFLMVPVIAGVAFEFTKLSGKYADNALASVLIKPGLWLQKMTTREPAPDQVEVALRALREVL